jgi:hypothetical protein
VAHHLLGDAPDHEMRQAGAAGRGHDDGVHAARRGDDALVGIADDDLAFDARRLLQAERLVIARSSWRLAPATSSVGAM